MRWCVLVRSISASCARRVPSPCVLIAVYLAVATLLFSQTTLDNMSQAEVLSILRTINAQLTNRVIDQGSPEGAFLEAVGNYRPFSPVLIEQLIVMVDIHYKTESRAERYLTPHSPCASALVAGLTDPLPVIEATLKRPNLPPAVKPVLVELKKGVELALAGRARTAERKKQEAAWKALPPEQRETITVPPTEQWPFPRIVKKLRADPKSVESLPAGPSTVSPSSTPWSVVAVLIVSALGLLWLLAKKRK